MQVHPSQISPGEPFDIFYFIRNWTDSTTYYVQAKVYDVRTGQLIATHALTQSPTNARLFIKTIDAPPDPTGFGRNVVAIATVYTDSGYTAKSENYEEQEQYYLIKTVLPFVGGGGLDARTTREIFAEELKKALQSLPKPEKLQVPDAPDMSFVDALFGTLGAITREVGKIPKAHADFSALIEKVDATRAALDARPQFERADFSGINDFLSQIVEQLFVLTEAIKRGDAALIQSFESTLQKNTQALASSLGAKVEEVIQSQEITLPVSMRVGGKKAQSQESSDPIAPIKHLMRA